MVLSDGTVTRYATGKLFLLGMAAERLRRVVAEVRELLDREPEPDAPELVAAAQRLYRGEASAVVLLHQMHGLAGGVVPWRVCEQINGTYFDVRANLDVTGLESVAVDTDRISSLVVHLEEALLPDWDTRAKLPKQCDP